MIVFKVKKSFRSCGQRYLPGHIFSQEEFLNPNILRLGKVKVSEGFIVPLFLPDEPSIVEKELPTPVPEEIVEEIKETPKPKRPPRKNSKKEV